MYTQPLNEASFKRLAAETGYTGANLESLVKSYVNASNETKLVMIRSLQGGAFRHGKAPQTK